MRSMLQTRPTSLDNITQQLTARIHSDLVDEIDELCRFAVNIGTSLQDASGIVNAVLNPENAIVLKPVLDALSTCKTQYNATLKESLYVADKAHEAANRFGQLYNDVLSKADTPTDKQKEAIVNCISTLDIEAKGADNLETYYKSLRSEIDTYFQLWNSLTGLLGIEVPVNVAKVDEAVASNTKIIAGLDADVNKQVLSSNLALSSSGVTTSLVAICAQSYTSSICDAVVIDDLGDALLNAKKQRDGAQSSLNDQILQRRLLEAELKAFEALAAIVADVDVAFEKIIHIFDVLTNIWAALRSDLQAISTQLDLVHDTIDRSLLDGRMRTAASMYEALSAALKQYKNISIPLVSHK
ncbi:hypothetical protein H0H87_001131 [Tephrocybe sp. NHM501043]|nr:hypothetical protein H0H87_001131 [Tephrocybe sp. NHM501043]